MSDVHSAEEMHDARSPWDAREVLEVKLMSAGPVLRVERRLQPRDRAEMERWQQSAFDRLLTSSGATCAGGVELIRGRAPRLRLSSVSGNATDSKNPCLDWQLSASHTGAGARTEALAGTYLAVAAQQGENDSLRVGVDIEQRRSRPQDRIAAMEKLMGWSTASQSSDEFYRRWTAAEAIFKTGLLAVASTVDWFRLAAPLASVEPNAGHSSGHFCLAGWTVRLRWCEPEASLTLCLLSASLEKNSQNNIEMNF